MDAIDNFPDLAPTICKIFAGWAQIEMVLELLFLRSTRARSREALAVFDVIETQRLRIKAISAAASCHLKPCDFAALEVALSLVKRVSRTRNLLAHNSWGWDEKIPNEIYLVPPSVATKIYKTIAIQLSQDLSEKREPIDGKLSKDDLKKILVYNKAELEKSALEIREVYGVLFNLISLMKARESKFHIPIDQPSKMPGTVHFAFRELLKSDLFRQARRQYRMKARSNNA